MKKILMSMVLAMTLGVAASPAAQAALIVVMPGSIVAISPNLFAWFAFGGSIAGFEFGYKYHGRLKAVTFGYLALGLLMDTETKSTRFAPLTDEQAAALKVSPLELASYNTEVDRLNALLEESVLTLSQTPKDKREEIAKDLHENLMSEVTPETLSAMKKVVSAALKAQ